MLSNEASEVNDLKNDASSFALAFAAYDVRALSLLRRDDKAAFYNCR
jgi:hypothetical protein